MKRLRFYAPFLGGLKISIFARHVQFLKIGTPSTVQQILTAVTVFENSVNSFLPDVVLLLDDLAVGEVTPVGAGRPRPGARRHGEQPESRDQDREGRPDGGEFLNASQERIRQKVEEVYCRSKHWA